MKSPKPQPPDATGVDTAVKELGNAAGAKKCWHCGCLHHSLRAIEEAYQGICATRITGCNCSTGSLAFGRRKV